MKKGLGIFVTQEQNEGLRQIDNLTPNIRARITEAKRLTKRNFA